jgi:hypothetical protein
MIKRLATLIDSRMGGRDTTARCTARFFNPRLARGALLASAEVRIMRD